MISDVKIKAQDRAQKEISPMGGTTAKYFTKNITCSKDSISYKSTFPYSSKRADNNAYALTKKIGGTII
jgi:hypothetical protein